MTQSKVVIRTELTEHEAVWLEESAMGSWPDTVHGTRLQIDKDGTRHILALVTLIVVDVNALQLELHQVLISTSVFTSGLDAMFVTDDFPELEKKMELQNSADHDRLIATSNLKKKLL